MIDKLKFNNLLISNKKPIEQGRTQTINKLMQKIRKLKGLLEKKPDDDKNKDRLRKTTENLSEIKKLKRIEVIQSLLLLDKNPTSIVTNGRASPAEIALALLAMNKILQTLVKKFRDTLEISTAADEAWKDEIMEVSKRRSKINRTEEKRQQRKDQKEQKAIGQKRVEWMQEQNSGGTTVKAEGDLEQEEEKETEAKEELTTLPATGVWKVEPLEVAAAEEIKENAQKKVAERKPKSKKPQTQAKLPKNTERKANKPNRHLDEAEKTDATELKRVEIKREAAGSSKSEDDDEDADAADTEPATTHIVDPFFFTASGENYLSTAVIEREEANENGEAEERMHMGGGYRKEWDEQRKMQNENRRRRGEDDSNPVDNRRGGSSFQSGNRRGGGGSGGNFRNDNRGNFQMRNGAERSSRQAPPIKRQKTEQTHSKATATEKGLHPSWAAKQKLKPVISSFQGKKITFGEADDKPSGFKSKTNGAPREKYDRNNGNSKRQTVATATAPAAEKLHPSWVAKQKLKPNITAFAGKKTTFDD